MPGYRIISDECSRLVEVIERSLRVGINRYCSFNVEFRTDVFKYLFDNKGQKPPRGRGTMYTLDDFDNTYFPGGWYVVYDSLGDGCMIEFPVRLESKVKWSPVVYNKVEQTSVPKPRHFSEMIFVTLVKTRC